MTWQFRLMDLPSRTWLAHEVQLLEAKVSETVNGPASISGKLPLAVKGQYPIKDRGSLIVAQYGNRQPIVCIADSLGTDGDDLKVSAGGFSMYPKDQPWTAVPFSSTSVDPTDIVRMIWQHLQSFPAGNLGVQVATTKSSVRLGTPERNDRYRARLAVIDATNRLNAANATTSGEAKAQSIAKNSLLAAAARPANGLIIHQVTAPTGDKRTKSNLWLDKDSSNRAHVWDGKKWIALAAPVQAVVAGRFTSYLAADAQLTALKKVAAVRKTELANAKTALSKVQGGEADPYTVSWWETHDLGALIDDLAENTPFEYRESATLIDSDLTLRLDIGVPSLGARRTDIRFEIGVNATVTPSLVEGDFASEISVLGSGEGRAMRRAVVSGNPGRLRRATVVSRKELTTNEAAARAARIELSYHSAEWTFDALDVIDHSLAPYGSYRPGDQVLVVGDAGWKQINSWVRITEITTDCTTGAIELKVEVV